MHRDDLDQWELFCAQPREEPQAQSEEIECACSQWLKTREGPTPHPLEILKHFLTHF